MTVYYCRYDDPASFFTHDELVEMNKTEHNLFARAEDSGCEGCYAEVARCSPEGVWERLAFSKFFDNEVKQVSAYQRATNHANEINEGRCTIPFIAKLPSAIEVSDT